MSAEKPRVLLPPPILYAVAIGLGLWLERPLPWPLPGGAARFWTGAVLIALAVLLFGWCLRELRRHQTTINPHRAASHLVTSGPFRFSRNPIYVSLTVLQIGVALLAAWTQPAVHAWLQESLHTLRRWKARQTALLQAQGWQVLESDAPFFCARPSVADVPALCAQLRRHGVRLRDCSSFGLPGLVRLGVRAPASQDALLRAWREIGGRQEASRPVEGAANVVCVPDAQGKDCPPAGPTR